MKPILVWFRRDLRVADNPALAAVFAAAANGEVAVDLDLGCRNGAGVDIKADD